MARDRVTLAQGMIADKAFEAVAITLLARRNGLGTPSTEHPAGPDPPIVKCRMARV
jgi:hypothetical protein